MAIISFIKVYYARSQYCNNCYYNFYLQLLLLLLILLLDLLLLLLVIFSYFMLLFCAYYDYLAIKNFSRSTIGVKIFMQS